VNNLTTDPSNPELRSSLINTANDLVNQIKLTYNTLASLQDEADTRITHEVDTVNTITSQIAQLNGRITAGEANGGTAADERDQRDVLLQKLAGEIGFSTIENSDGSDTISLANGFVLVDGTNSRSLSVTKTPSFAPGGAVPPSLSGGALNFITFNYGTAAAPSDVDLTQVLQTGGGNIGGLLDFRGTNAITDTTAFQANGKVVDMASRVEAIARGLLTTVNQTYLGTDTNLNPVDANAVAPGFQPSSRALDAAGNPTVIPPVFGLFDFTYGGTKDANANGTPDAADLNAAMTGAGKITSFASVLAVTPVNPNDVAAATDPAAAGGVVNLTSGNGLNMENLAKQLNSNIALSSDPSGAYTATTTLEDAFNQGVGLVGSLQSTTKSNLSVAQAKYTSAASSRDQVSAVSLDEEFTNLIQFQKAYQASARMVKVANDLMDQVLQLL
jgi:flagellar hook-associated protein 1 FlgK